jgi:excisionase family DNA binding protein
MSDADEMDDDEILAALLRSATMSTDMVPDAPPRRSRPEREKAKSEVLTIDDAADMLGIHYTTAKRLALHGKLPGAFKLGSQWRVSRAALLKFLDNPDG